MTQKRSVTIVTGASQGLGAEIARELAARGHDLVLTARREAELEALAREIAATEGPEPIVIPLDLAAPGASATLLAALPAERYEIAGLVNNAGYGLMGDVAVLPASGQLGMIDLNIRALTELTIAALPRMKRPGGRILNVASVAGFSPGPGMAIYYASKAYVVSFSEAMWQETKGSGVSVTTLCPGPLATGFWGRATAGGAPPTLLKLLPQDDVRSTARAGVEAMLAGRRRVTPGLANLLLSWLAPFSPRALLLPMMQRFQARRAAR